MLLYSAPHAPRFYGLPKLHKAGVPLRPILAAYGSPTHNIAKFVSRHVNTLLGFSPFSLKNSKDFIGKLPLSIGQDDIMGSFDVTSLFTNVPISCTLEYLSDRLESAKVMDKQNILLLTRLCLQNTYFVFRDSYYKQLEGAPMGSPLSPPIANLFMEEFEVALMKSDVLKPKVWLRYVDDVFFVWSHGLGELYNFLDYINDKFASIKFTMELESNNSLPFLDVRVTKSSNGVLSTNVYRKPSDPELYIRADSCHTRSHKLSAYHYLLNRCDIICKNDVEKANERNHILEVASLHGFDITDLLNKSSLTKKEVKPKPEHFCVLPLVPQYSSKIAKILRRFKISISFKPPINIGNFLNTKKDKLEILDKSGVYMFSCLDCNLSYIGQTIRRIFDRRNGHLYDISSKNEDATALSKHVIFSNHKIDWDHPILLASSSHWKELNILEGIYINNTDRLMNDSGGYKYSKIWQSILPF